MVGDAFGTFGPPLAAPGRAGRRRVGGSTSAPRDGKRGGAFCMSVRERREPRAAELRRHRRRGVSTLAHELGHAYHNTQLADRTRAAAPDADGAGRDGVDLLRDDPAPVAPRRRRRRTAASCCSRPTCRAPARSSSTSTPGSCSSGRCSSGGPAGPLSVAELRELMTGAQQEAYGDGLDAEHLHPDMWAVKPHYYATAFYNWPYTYGLLFGIGLYARYLAEDPTASGPATTTCCRPPGSATAAELAARFGIDVADEAFWTASLDVLRARIDDFVALAARWPS